MNSRASRSLFVALLAVGTASEASAAWKNRTPRGPIPVAQHSRAEERSIEATQVVILMADDIGFADIREIPTPNIDALAARGVSYTRTYSMPACTATRSTIFFGKYLSRHYTSACHTTSNSDIEAPAFDSELVSIAELFPGERGFVGKWHLGKPWKTAAGLHGYDSWCAQSTASPRHCGPGRNYFRWTRVDNGVSTLDETYMTTAQVDEAILWLSTPHPRGSFLNVNFNSAHEPFHDPPGFVTDGELRSMFEAMVVSVDDAVGKIMAAVDLSKTLVIFTSDNGTPDVVAPVQGKAKQSTFERGVRVPLILVGPGIPSNVSLDRLTHMVDLYATFQTMAGLPLTGDGVPLQDPTGHDLIYLGHRRPTIDDQAVFDGRYKLRRFLDSAGNGFQFQLYDLAQDPYEDNPHGPSHPQWDRLMNLLLARMQS